MLSFATLEAEAGLDPKVRIFALVLAVQETLYHYAHVTPIMSYPCSVLHAETEMLPHWKAPLPFDHVEGPHP